MVALVTCAILAAAPADVPILSQSREMMATKVVVILAGVSEDRAERALRAAFSQFERVEQVMNEWQPDSPLSAINAAAGSGKFVEAPADLCDVLQTSLSAAERTNGLFDPTWAALRDLWRFGTAQTGDVPSADAVKAACPLVSYKGVEVQRSKAGGTCRVRLKQPRVKLGLGGVAKGWGVDRAVSSLRALGLKNFLVQAGGDLYAAGRRGSRPWQVGIRDPRGPADSYFARVEVSDAAFSTSGDYERFFIAGGKRYHHIIDPRTCYPATASRSSTVLARSALEAEFLTKATFISGGERALKLAESWGAGVVLVTSDNKVLISKSLEGKVEHWAPTP